MRHGTIRLTLTAAGGLAVAVVLAACGSSSGASGSAATAPAVAASSSPAGGGAGGAAPNRGPAASGKVAAISGTTMQVQNQQSGQVAVTWTASTTFSHEVRISDEKITVGSCVVATASSSSSSTSSPLAATRVVLSSATNGTCGGGGFPGGARPSGRPTGQRPSGRPTDLPSGGARPSNFPGGGNRGGSFAVGKVTAKSGNSLTVEVRGFGSSGSTTRTVLLGASTTVYEQASTSAKSLAVGACVTAQGSADSSGTVKATRVQISPPTNGTCTAGFEKGGQR